MGVPGEELRLVAERTAEVMFLVFAHHTGWECSWERPVHGQEVSAAGGSLARRKSRHARNQAGEGVGRREMLKWVQGYKSGRGHSWGTSVAGTRNQKIGASLTFPTPSCSDKAVPPPPPHQQVLLGTQEAWEEAETRTGNSGS